MCVGGQQDVLQALLAGLRGRRLRAAAAVQAADAAPRHPGQSQRGAALRLLRVGAAAGAHVLRPAGAGGGGGARRAGVWHQGRGGPGNHLHAAAAGERRAGAAQGAGDNAVQARPGHLPEHLHHLHLGLQVSLLSTPALPGLTLPLSGHQGGSMKP